jgi:hypothetical protein
MKTFNQPLPELKFDKNRFRVKNCPCGKSNKDGKFVPYIGYENKGYCHSCGETFLPDLPKVEQWNDTQPTAYQPRIAAPQPKQLYFGCFFQNSTTIEIDTPYFTEINTYSEGGDKLGVLCHYSLNSLSERLNKFKNQTGIKANNPAILKGIYRNGTAGEFCETSSPYLFFDIDVKETENKELLNPEINNKVFDTLKDMALLIWRSNSQKGIAGILFVPELKAIGNNDTETHLNKARSIYICLSNYIKNQTGISVIFDWQQGKFRQIRYLAEQQNYRSINRTPLCFGTTVKTQPKPASYISNDIFLTSLQAYSENNFVHYLKTLFGFEVCKELVKRYCIGTSKHWNGATVFWLIDAQHKIRTGKIMLYNPTTGKRVQQPYDHINWVHYVLKLPEFEKKVCLFGEHLLNDKTKPVAIVESEKTAVIASVHYPQFIWLASGGKDGLNAEKCSVLKGRSVTLFPDLDGFEKWSAKARELKHIAKFNVSDLLERKATEAERKGKFDIADYLIRFDYQPEATEPPQPIQEVPILPTKEELQYSKMVSRTPSIEMLVKQLGLVSATTGKQLNKFEV